MVEQLEGNIARQAGFMLAQDEKVVALQAEIERLSAKYNDAHLRALKAEAGAPAPCVWRERGDSEEWDVACGWGASTRAVKLGVVEFHPQHDLRERFYAVVDDLRASGSIVDLWLMDIATVLKEFDYDMQITTRKPKP